MLQLPELIHIPCQQYLAMRLSVDVLYFIEADTISHGISYWHPLMCATRLLVAG